MDSYILCGMQFGDEGKGTFVDYLAHEKNINCIVRYNGGSQASHTVITPEGVCHKFSQLGSGMFMQKCHIYITENMVVNLDNLLVELDVFSKQIGIPFCDLLERVHIHEKCYVVTPYHKLINKLRELSKGKNRRGSVGTGVSEVRYLLNEPKELPYDLPLGLQVKDVFNPYTESSIIHSLERLYDYTLDFYKTNLEEISKNMPSDMKEALEKEIEFLLGDKAYLKIADGYVRKFRKYSMFMAFRNNCLYNTYELSYKQKYKNAIFEGAQGLLIDQDYGIKPNTTHLDTTNCFALEISGYTDNVSKIGIAKAFCSRHGMGVFPTESKYINTKITDENQDSSYWNGSIRFGWFDAVLFRYAQSINQVDELYLSSLDKLNAFRTIKVCNEYLYNGVVDEKFDELFSYSTTSDGKIVITDIKKSGEELGKYLKSCVPIYLYVKGWKENISDVTDKSKLPENCLNYILLLEELTKLPITLVSVGPTRNNKIRMC